MTDSWEGQLRGLALYDQELTAEQVQHHYQTWARHGRPDIDDPDRAVAFYLFDELRGDIVRDHGSSGINLYIPDHYMILRE